MKKIIAFVAMAIMLVGLSGCIDDQDGSGGKLPTKELSK